MKVLLCSLLVLVGAAAAAMLGSNQCTWGPKFWCKDLKSATTCSAVQHCTEYAWKVDRAFTVDVSSACQFCQDIIGDVKNFILSNATRATVEEYMNKACSLLPDSYAQKECTDIKEHYLDEFMKMIEDDINPRTICTLVRLCSQNTVTPAVAHDAAKSQMIDEVKSGGILECDACKAFVDYVKSDLDKTATQTQILQAAKVECDKLGGELATECYNLVKKYMPDIVTLVENNLDTMCVTLGMCDSTTGQLAEVDYHAILVTSLRDLGIDQEIQKLSAIMSLKNDFCTTCEEVFGYIRIFMNNNSTMMEAEDLLKHDICPQLKEFSSECQDLVEEYFPKIWSTLMSYLEPLTVCVDLGLCNSTATHVVKSGVLLAPMSDTEVDTTPFCPICEFVIEKLNEKLDDNATEAEIVAAVEKVCHFLPSSIRDDCDEFITKYGKEIIEALVRGDSPSIVCTLIDLCSTPNKGVDVSGVAEWAECDACKMVLNYVKTRVNDGATQERIEQQIEKLCSYLNADLVPKCKAMIDQVAPQFIKALADDLNPQQLCVELGMCTAAGKVDGLVHMYKTGRPDNW